MGTPSQGRDRVNANTIAPGRFIAEELGGICGALWRRQDNRQDNLAGQSGRKIRQENQLRTVAAALVVLEVCLGALASGGCFAIPGAGLDRLNTAASMALITFCCMISFLSIEMCPTPGTFCTSTFSSAPWNCLLFSTGVPAPLAI
jgi:hypothetical protein